METFGIRIYKEYFNFAAAHFLLFEDGTREELHGHNYQVQMAIEGTLDTGKAIFIDFLHIKPIVKAICDSIDHKTLLPQFSTVLLVERQANAVEALYTVTGDRWVFPGRDVVIVPVTNTSVELLAKFLCLKTLEALKEQYPEATICKVEFSVEESRGQASIYRLDFDEPKRLKTFETVDALTLS